MDGIGIEGSSGDEDEEGQDGASKDGAKKKKKLGERKASRLFAGSSDEDVDEDERQQGAQDSDEREDEDEEDEDEVFFKIRKPAQKDPTKGLDSSRVGVFDDDALQDWSDEELLESVRGLFVTSDYKDQEAASVGCCGRCRCTETQFLIYPSPPPLLFQPRHQLLEAHEAAMAESEDEELYGDFEDLETGEKFTGPQGASSAAANGSSDGGAVNGTTEGGEGEGEGGADGEGEGEGENTPQKKRAEMTPSERRDLKKRRLKEAVSGGAWPLTIPACACILTPPHRLPATSV